MSYEFLIHGIEDHVGVAVRDLKHGELAQGAYQQTLKPMEIQVQDDIPLGHKIALVNLNPGDRVIEYNEVIGVATGPIQAGQHAHVQNIKSVRWA